MERNKIKLIVIDLGAGSGRLMYAEYSNSKLELSTIHRFHNKYSKIQGHYYWDILNIWFEILSGLKKEAIDDISGISVCSWGADFCMVDKAGSLCGFPFTYRDARTNGIVDEISDILNMSQNEWGAHTGVLPAEHYALCQLFALKRDNPDIYKATDEILFIADTINFFLTGKRACDFTNISTTAAFDWKNKALSQKILSKLQINSDIFPETIKCGAVLGKTTEDLAETVGLKPTDVIISGGHDTGVVSMLSPRIVEKNIMLNCGTWAIMGYISSTPFIARNGKNTSISSFGTPSEDYFINKYFGAMWFLQECISQWSSEGKDFSYPELVKLAEKSSIDSIINIEYSGFMMPSNMPCEITEYIKKTHQESPVSQGDIARVIIQSVALHCRKVLSQLSSISGEKFEKIYFVGGANQNAQLCKMIADFTGCMVITGPVEATSFANACMQLYALGHLSSFEDFYKLAQRSVKKIEYRPENSEKAEDLFSKYIDLQNV